MQVAGSTTSVVRSAYANPILDRKLAATAGGASAHVEVAGAAASYIASSTRLSSAEKSSFINQLGDVSDAKVIASIMAVVQQAESTRTAGTYPATSLEKALDEKTHRSAFKVRAEQSAMLAAGLDLFA